MALLSAVTGLLWIIISALVFAIGVVLFHSNNRLSHSESALSAAVLVLLATPIVLQIRTLAARKRELKSNLVQLDEGSIHLQLNGPYRTGKGLPEIAETRIPWSDVLEITRQRRKFLYRSLIPFEYPLEVYTIVTEDAEFPFTRECVPGAKRVAEQIAARLGQEI